MLLNTWGSHAKEVQEMIMESAVSFLQDSNLVSCAVQTRLRSTYRYPRYTPFPERRMALHLVASFGLLTLCERLSFRHS